MKEDILLKELSLGENLTLKNRIVMAPMTRSKADDNLVPTTAMADCYARRANTGLIISEATVISPLAQGYPNTPGLFNSTQVAGWKKVTDKVHQHGGKIFAQIWHTGRVSHPVYLNGDLPIAPSEVALSGRVPRTDDLQYGMPREMTEVDIQNVIEQFAVAASNAKKAGFDGVELHAANGYLLDQFLHYETKKRQDKWGGSPENMARILFEVINAVKQEIEHVGIRLSPVGYLHVEHDHRDIKVFDHLLLLLNRYQLAYVHTGMFDDCFHPQIEGTVTQYIRRYFEGIVIANGGYDAKMSSDVVTNGDADLVAIGRPLIANPDYVEKIRYGLPMVEYNAAMLDELV